MTGVEHDRVGRLEGPVRGDGQLDNTGFGPRCPPADARSIRPVQLLRPQGSRSCGLRAVPATASAWTGVTDGSRHPGVRAPLPISPPVSRTLSPGICPSNGLRCAYEEQSRQLGCNWQRDRQHIGLIDSQTPHERGPAAPRSGRRHDARAAPPPFQPCLRGGFDTRRTRSARLVRISARPSWAVRHWPSTNWAANRQHYGWLRSTVGAKSAGNNRAGTRRRPLLRPGRPDALRPARREVHAGLHMTHDIEYLFECLEFPSIVS
jgi:hypothetical protein